MTGKPNDPAQRLQAGGTLNPKRHLYVERDADDELFDLLKEGNYANVLTSRQMGKSSLMVRTVHRLDKTGIRWVTIDVAAELGGKDDLNGFYLGLLGSVGRQLRIELDLAEWWDEFSAETVNQRVQRYFRDVVCEQIPGPVVVFLDEIDATLRLDYTDDLFTAIRGMYNERPIVKAYENITFCLLGVATPNELIKDQRTTAYNVGTTLELRDFDPVLDDLKPFSQALSADEARASDLLERVLFWTDGHPYLTQRICGLVVENSITEPQAIDDLIEDNFASLERARNDVHFQQVLRFLQKRLTSQSAALKLYRNLLDGQILADQTTLAHAELKLSGLVKRDGNGNLVCRNRLYERIFSKDWLNSLATIRNETLYRRGLIASLAVITVLLGIGSYLAIQEFRINRAVDALVQLSIRIEETGDTGKSIVFPRDAPQQLLAAMVDEIALVSRRFKELTLSGTRVSDLAPLKGLTGLETIRLEDTQISDLAPLRELTGLRGLWLSGSQVKDLMPLKELTRLETLWFNRTQISDLSPLKGLTGLREIWFDYSQVSDLAPVSGLTGLKILSLDGTQTSDLTPLSGLTGLQTLWLVQTQVRDLSPLRELPRLRELFLSDTQISDLAPLGELPGLQQIDLDDTQIRNLAPLSRLIGLKSINLDNTRISDLAPLRGLTGLESLSLDNTRVSDLAPLRELAGLQELFLSNTQISDLAPLSGTTKLQQLYLTDTQISDLAPLRKLSALNGLGLNGTRIGDLAPLRELTGLNSLSLDDTPVSDLAPLEGLAGLASLSLNDTRVSDLAPLKRLTGLERLGLNGTGINDLAPLRGLTGLRNLNLDRTQVSDLAPLKEITALRELWLNDTQVSDLVPLKGLTRLRSLSLDNTRISDPTPLRGLTELGELYLNDTRISEADVSELRKVLRNTDIEWSAAK